MQIEWIKLYLSILDHRKIAKLEKEFGANRGLGIYVRFILNLAKVPDHRLNDADFDVFADLCKLNEEEFIKFINLCGQTGLLIHEDNYWYSPRLNETLADFDHISAVNSQNAKKKWDNFRKTQTPPTPPPKVQSEPIPDIPKIERRNRKQEHQDLIAYWNTKKIKICKVYRPQMETKINALIDKYGIPLIKQAMDNYAADCHLPGSWRNQDKNRQWNFYEFMTREKGLPVWVDKEVEDPKDQSTYKEPGKSARIFGVNNG